MARILFYDDERALAAYLGGAALLEPELAEARCEAMRLVPADEEGPARRALLFTDDELALPEDRSRTTRVAAARVDAARRELTLQGDGRARFRVTEAAGARELARVLPPIAWDAPPPGSAAQPEVIYLVQPGAPFARLVTQHLELGRDRLRYASVATPAGERVLLEVPEPSWFLLERWLEDHPEEARVYRRLEGPFGPRRVYVEWGYRHPLEAWLSEPADEGLLLLIDKDGGHATLTRGALSDVGQALELDPTRFASDALVPAAEPERVAVALRLEGRTAPSDPELWILPAAQRARLEELLAHTPEEELRNLLVACAADAQGERVFVVREVLAGRAPQLLPVTGRAYAPLPGLPNLLLPCERTIAPPLSSERYARAFALRPGELTILDPAPGDDPRAIAVTRLPEAAFGPIERIVDFVFEGDAAELAEVVRTAPFELGEFAEEDLVPTAARAARPARAKPKERARPEPQRPAPTPERKGSLIHKLLQPFRPPAEEERPEPGLAQDDARQRELERVQRELVLGAATPEGWLELSRLCFAEGDGEEGLRALENAVWTLARAEGEEALEVLERTLGPAGSGGGAAQDTADLYRRVLAFRGGGGHDVDAHRGETEAVYGELREHEDRLRKKSRWLLWWLVLRETGDAIELERQREAILSDLVLRGVEEREVPPFVRHLLLEQFGQRAATGSGAADALGFLEQARAFCAHLAHPALRSEALAHVAWALAELGQGEPALAAAAEAERFAASRQGVPPHDAWRARAVARVGAVLERVRGRDQGRAHLERALEQVTRLLPSGAVAQPTPEMVDGRKAVVSWLGALADAWVGAPRRDDPLLRRALEVIEGRPPNDQSTILHEAADALQRLGLAAEARDLADRLLRAADLRRARDALRDFTHPEDAYRVHVQNVMECMERFRGGEPVPPEAAEAILEVLRGAPELIDEFAIHPLLAALRGLRTGPWEAVDALARLLIGRQRLYEARLVRIAGLRRLAELRERERGAELLERALGDAWGDDYGVTDPQQRSTRKHRVVTRLVTLVPAFGMRQRGLELLQGVNRRAQEHASEGVYFRNELLLATALAASKLGDSRASFELIEETAELAMRDYQVASQPGARGRQGPSWLLFETLDACVDGAAELGEIRRGTALVARVAALARQALEQAREGPARTEGRYFFCRTLIRCGHAALTLGDLQAASEHFGASLAQLAELNSYDQIELLQEAATTAGELEGARRYQLARQVLDSARAPVEAAAGNQDRFAAELIAQVAHEMIQGESAFAAALKRWRGREERSIRDRVAHEELE